MAVSGFDRDGTVALQNSKTVAKEIVRIARTEAV